MKMMDLEERQRHAESIHHFDTPISVQLVKSKELVVLINMELRYRYRQHLETDVIPGLSFSEAQIATWMNRVMTKITLPKTVRW